MAETKTEYPKGEALHDLFREVFAFHAALSGIIDTVHEQAGLSTSRLKVMRVLVKNGPATVPDVAALLGVSRQFVQTVCNNLLGEGLLEFTENPRHKRSRLAMLTEPGLAAFRESRRRENGMIEQALPDIDPGRASEACELLKEIREALERSE